MGLKYRGTGEYIPGVPAQDLDDEALEAVARIFNLSVDETIEQLTARGLYTVERKRRSTGKTETIDDEPTEIEET